MEYLWFVLAGIVSGVVAGMGMGGGTLLIPVLIIFFNIAQQQAQGINLLAFIPCAIVSLIIHIKNKLVNFKIGLPILFTGIIASVFASILAVNTNSKLLQIMFGVFLLVVGVYQAISTLIIILPIISPSLPMLQEKFPTNIKSFGINTSFKKKFLKIHPLTLTKTISLISCMLLKNTTFLLSTRMKKAKRLR